MTRLNGTSPARRPSPPAPGLPTLPARDRALHARWLLEITQIPTAAGREQRVIGWIREWVAERADLRLSEDRAGNMVIARVSGGRRGPKSRGGRASGGAPRPVYITAHLDHPAFVVERIIAPGLVELAFRGGVMDQYFPGAAVTIHTESGALSATINGEGLGVASLDGGERLFKTYLAEVDGDAGLIAVGDIATWALPEAEIDAGGLVHTAACDDLAALAAALAAIDTLRLAAAEGREVGDVRLLFTRSEEIGFTGAIAACKLGTVEKSARVIALENSRSFPDSPIGGGPIVRVGDRMSIFSPVLTAACAKRAEQLAAEAGKPGAGGGAGGGAGPIKWQRKLMAGGACEATVFCAYGYEATCLCLPLGNYHNMAHLDEVQGGTYDAARLGLPRVAREFIALSDFEGLVDLLVAIGLDLPAVDPAVDRLEKLYARHAFVLGPGVGGAGEPKPRGKKPRTATPRAKAGAKGKSASRKAKRPAKRATSPRRR